LEPDAREPGVAVGGGRSGGVRPTALEEAGAARCSGTLQSGNWGRRAD
jgi:hypothetical protein